VTASLIVLQLPQVQTTELHKGTDVWKLFVVHSAPCTNC
jgi:hypothetical protein